MRVLSTPPKPVLSTAPVPIVQNHRPQPPTLPALTLTIVCDLTFLLMTAGAGVLMHALVVGIWPVTQSSLEKEMLEWMPFWALLSTAAWFLLTDGLRHWRARRPLPFDLAPEAAQELYWQRFEVIVWAIASHLVLLCLCLLMPNQPLISKLFLSSIVALVTLAARKSVRSRKNAFAASMSIFSMVMLMISIAGVLG